MHALYPVASKITPPLDRFDTQASGRILRTDVREAELRGAPEPPESGQVGKAELVRLWLTALVGQTAECETNLRWSTGDARRASD